MVNAEQTLAILFVNGELVKPAAVRSMIEPDHFLVAVDGGLRHLHTLNLKPHLLIGDLDSVSVEEVESLAKTGVEILRYPVEKDETDLELALGVALARGYPRMRIVGALGGRLDQTLGNLFLLTQPALSSCDIRLQDGQSEVFVIRQQAEIEGKPGETVSLIPLQGAAEGISTQGLRYPLANETLYPEKTRGISNELMEQRAEVSVRQGVLLCIHILHEGSNDQAPR